MEITKGDSEMEVRVYLDFVNAWGDITDSTEIARFQNMRWAEKFIEEAKKEEDKITRIRVECKQ